MAGDWIKMRTNLDRDPAVVRISSGLKTDRFAVVGRLHTIWAWANEHLVDGQDVPIDSAFLDALVECPGFAEQMRRVGWLSGRDGSLDFPGFERHNGASAKARAMDSERKKSVRKMSGLQPDENRTREEKRREEELHTHTPREPAARKPEAVKPEPVGWAAEEWQRFVAVWNATERAEPWRHLTAPDGWADLAAAPGWLDRALQALAMLPSRAFFVRPLPLTRFFGYIDRIRAGEFADAQRPAPQSVAVKAPRRGNL